ncbi:MAG: VPLPA-CTERM sorting domain-containing protein [Paracoccaceae bacterium]|nr:VPLPA-CTERM sorting domain-containing protein [Paracoccaceae bacterium]
MTTLKTLATAAAFVVGSVVAASAATFNFAGSGGYGSSFSFSDSGVNVDVTATTYQDNGAVTGNFAYVGQWGSGLGVYSHSGDSHQVDGANRNDLLQFVFDQTVRIVSVTFSYVDWNDDFTLHLDNSYVGSADIPNSGTYTFQSSWIGTSFGIGAYGYHDNFKVLGMTVAPSAVPLPASALLLGAGLLGFAGLRRRKS